MPTLKFWNEVTGQWEYILGAAGGYQHLTTVYYTPGNSGTFEKADYPGLRAVKVRLSAGGGAGAGSANNNTGGASGGAGGYAEGLVLAEDLAASETVTVGLGGTAVTGATGGSGESSSFGSHVAASGGEGGHDTTGSPFWGGQGGVGTAGDLLIRGGDGSSQADPALYTAMYIPGQPGGSGPLGGGGRGAAARASNSNGAAGGDYGGGGGGGFRRNASVAGGRGGHGIVIVEVYV